MRARFKSALGFILMLLIIAIVLFAFYFVYKKMRSSDGDIKITGALSINFHNGKKINIDKEFKTKITVINNGNEDIYYYIEFINPKNASGVTYTLTDNALINVSDQLPKHNEIISSYILIKKGEIHDYELTFKNTLDNVASVELDCEQEALNNNTFAETILKNNEIKSESKTIVGKDIATENEGLIKTVDDYGIAYYFRGNVQNNNVSINNLNFKIVRINGDGSVRLVLANDTGELKKYVDSNEKYSYKDSVIRAYLDSWITINLGDYTSFLATQKYCNDVLLNDNTFYAYTRVIEDYIPSFICLSDKVTSKVALLTVDEVLSGKTTDTGNEVKGLEAIKQSVNSITTAVNEKTEAFKNEEATVAKIIPETICFLPFYSNPENPQNAIAINPAVSNTIGIPLNASGTSFSSIFSRSPARITMEIVKPSAVAKPFTVPCKIPYSF